jgi:hypothetical protein
MPSSTAVLLTLNLTGGDPAMNDWMRGSANAWWSVPSYIASTASSGKRRPPRLSGEWVSPRSAQLCSSATTVRIQARAICSPGGRSSSAAAIPRGGRTTSADAIRRAMSQ